jgi:hypothetical protein
MNFLSCVLQIRHMVMNSALALGRPTSFRPPGCPSQRDAAAMDPLCGHRHTSLPTGDRWAPSRPSGRDSTIRRSDQAAVTPLSGYVAAHRRVRPRHLILSRRKFRRRNRQTAFPPDPPPPPCSAKVTEYTLTHRPSTRWFKWPSATPYSVWEKKGLLCLATYKWIMDILVLISR